MIGKIQKLKPFLKKSSDNLAKVISVLAKFMQTADHFPEICNDSKCNFIGKPPNDRAIFALESIPKIVETVVKTSFDAVKKEDGTMQMAYTFFFARKIKKFRSGLDFPQNIFLAGLRSFGL